MIEENEAENGFSEISYFELTCLVSGKYSFVDGLHPKLFNLLLKI